MTSTNEPITLGSGTWQGGGGTTTITAPGFVTTATTTMEAQSLVVTGSGKSSIAASATLTTNGLTVNPGAEFTTGASGDTLDIAGNSTLSGTIDGSGVFQVSGGTTTMSGTFTTPTVSVTSGGSLHDNIASIAPTAVTLNGGTLAIGSGDTVADSGAFSMLDASLDRSGSGTGTLTVGGNFDLTSDGEGASTVAANLSVTQNGSGTFAIGDNPNDGHGAPQLEDLATLITTNTTDSTAGAVTIDGTFTGAGAPQAVTSTNEPITLGSGTWQGGGGTTTITAPGFDFTSGTTMAAQTLVQSGGTMDLTSSDTLTVPDGYAVQAGTLTVDGTLTAPVTLTGGTLDGTGSVDGAVTNTSGNVEAGDSGVGALTVTGNYTQAAGGTITVPISGASSGDYPVLTVDGAVTLNGTVALQPTSGYANAAAQGDEISFLSYPNGNNDNNTTPTVTTVPPLHDGEQFNVEPIEADFWVAVVGSPAPPGISSPPVVSGTPQQGDMLSTTNGTWTNGPTQFSYQWEDCTSAAASSCTNISGATGSTYTLTATDVGKFVTVVVTASNASESSGAATGAPAIGPVTVPPPPAPTNTTAPTITGTPDVGDTVSCNPGTWTGSPTFSYTWELDGTVIPGATTSTYTIPTTAAGGKLTCVVSATNTGGSATAPGAPVGVPSVGVALPGPAPAPVPLLLSCSGKDVELVSVSVKGRFVLLAGIALKQFAGQRVTITLSDVSRKVAKGKGGATTVAADGTFQVKLPVPKGPTAGLTRYTATVAGHASLGLKLARALLITGEHNTPGGLQVSFKGTGVLAKGSHTIEIVQQVSCTKSTVFESKKLGPGAKLTVTLPAPAEAGSIAYYRAQTPTSAGLTYSLPIAVVNGS